MDWMIWIGLLVLMLLSYMDRMKTMGAKSWLLIVATYLACQFYVNLFGLVVPVGFFLGWLYAARTKRLHLAKALVFGLITVLAVAYVPKISLSEIGMAAQIKRETEQFNQIKAVARFTSDSTINADMQAAADTLKKNSPKSTIQADDPHVLFDIWVLRNRNVAVADLDWLWYEAPRELHFYWQSNRPDQLTDMEYVIFHDVGYMGVFKRANSASPYRLQSIYEFDRLKWNQPQIP
ncbi:hypothetical protein [Paenibacillus cymbidii]|uniref:hypothetical protein n=1 Tax=Paenibacillus cymbidii TaxID=1639034 RepID=UPI0010806598|nr:hypothetical protein [Paenibacillus cymbidii]